MASGKVPDFSMVKQTGLGFNDYIYRWNKSLLKHMKVQMFQNAFYIQIPLL
jgi:hypothetical protein